MPPTSESLGPLGPFGEEATSEGRLLTGRDSRTQEFLCVARISREFIRGFQALHFAPPCVTFFGSAAVTSSTCGAHDDEPHVSTAIRSSSTQPAEGA